MLDNHTIRSAIDNDAKQAMALLPVLADFKIPQYRNADHLWQGDARLLEQFFAGDMPDTHALVAVDTESNATSAAISSGFPNSYCFL